MKKIRKNESRCDNAPYCGAKRQCAVNAIRFDDESGRIVIDNSLCIGCGKCVGFCPHRALSLAEA